MATYNEQREVERILAEIAALEEQTGDKEAEVAWLAADLERKAAEPILPGSHVSVGDFISEQDAPQAKRRGRSPLATPGGRYVGLLRSVYEDILRMTRGMGIDRAWKDPQVAGGVAVAVWTLRFLDDPETRRMIVDAEQASLFDQADRMPPVTRLHLPFDEMYVETTQPVAIGEQEPDREDLLAAFCLSSEFGRQALNLTRFGIDGETLTWNATTAAAGQHQLVRVTMFFRSRDPDETDPAGRHDWADRTFFFDLLTQRGFSRHQHMTNHPSGDNSTPDANWLKVAAGGGDYLLAVRTEGEGRGWWERTIADYSQFIAWMLTYMTAKGIVIVEEEPPTRQQRRALARMKHRPAPWHIVTVDPTMVTELEPGEGTGARHSYRYDVRGHLRFGRHKRGDGSYSSTVEWVRPHQRGLANARYIPKTYSYDARSPGVDVLDAS